MSVVEAHSFRSRSASSIGDQLPMLEAMLVEQQQFRAQQLVELAEQLFPVSGASDDAAQREVVVKLTAAARRALEDVEAALLRLRDGSYGRCTTCRREIPVERLEILPQSAYCVQCQQQHEHRLG